MKNTSKSEILDSGLAPLLQRSSWSFGSSPPRWSVRSSRCVTWASWRTGCDEGYPGRIPGRRDDTHSSMTGRSSVVSTGRLCPDSCSRSSIDYGGCDTGGRNVWCESWQENALWTILFIQDLSELSRSQDTCVDPVLGSKLLSLQVKSALISAIDYGLIKTSYDYAAIESTLVPTMALLLGRINGMISWYQLPNISYKWHAKTPCQWPRSRKHPSKSLNWGNLTSIPSIWSSLTALQVSRLVIEKRSGLNGAKQNTFGMGEVETNFLPTKLRIFMVKTVATSIVWDVAVTAQFCRGEWPSAATSIQWSRLLLAWDTGKEVSRKKLIIV